MGAPNEKDPNEEAFGSARVLTFMLIAAGLAVIIWLVFARSEGALPGKYEPPVPTNQVTLTCTCRPTIAAP